MDSRIIEKLRPYQLDAYNAAISWMRKTIEPGLLEMATGAGKSWVVAAIAQWVHSQRGKRVLCLQPSKELTEQNHEKYLSTGERASIFSASAGGKCMRYPVVYGTPITVKNSISRFGDAFGAVLVDEAHGTTPTIRAIIEYMRSKNPYLRVMGLSATPYTMLDGYIYQYDVDGSYMDEDLAHEPYYNSLLYRITMGELVEMGFLTPPTTDPADMHYDAIGLELNRQGKFNDSDVERVFVGKGRLTSEIVADIVARSFGRRGVMIFAANVAHAKEILASLPPNISRMAGGDVNMSGDDRKNLVKDFKAQKFKYLVSVGGFTTGFDAPHVDVIALMRLSESPGLVQQMLGRGARLDDGKENFLFLDYAQNVERHELQDDLFRPEIKSRRGKKEKGEPIRSVCPDCNYENLFSARPNEGGFDVDENGYFLDAARQRVETEDGAIPAHYGRRCTGQALTAGLYSRCNYRWTAKVCAFCSHENDIAARFCEKCKEEMIDPNAKLQKEFSKVKKNPYGVHTDEVLEWWPREHIAQSGKTTLRVTYKTPYREFDIYYHPESTSQFLYAKWEAINHVAYKGHVAPSAAIFCKFLEKATMPKTITYKKEKGQTFYEAISYNRPPDMAKEVDQ